MPSRRAFLKTSLLAACSAAAHPWLSTVTLASAPGENRLVVIILRGAMDGIDLLQPYGDPALRGLRRSLSLGPEGGAYDLDGFYALHPAMAPLQPLWRAGELGFMPAVSTPYRDKRSHFDGQDLLEAGTGNDLPVRLQQGGWLNRLLQDMPQASAQTAYSVGDGEMLILRGTARAMSWTPQARLSLSPQARMLLDHVYHDDPLFRDAAVDAAEIVAAGGVTPSGGGGPIRALAQFTAARLSAETRIASFSIGGWDSHARQDRVIAAALARLAEAILTLREGLGPHWSRTAVLAMTEFGRTVRENGSAGTDHGTGGTLLMAGGALRGGRVIGPWPGLGEGQLYQDRDLMPLRDIRAPAAWALHGLFGTTRGVLEGSVFPGLDMGSDPGILA